SNIGQYERACAWLVSSFLAASKVATAALVWIWRFCDPCEFGADLVDRGIGARHFSSLPHRASTCASDKVSSCGTQAPIHRGASISNRHESPRQQQRA